MSCQWHQQSYWSKHKGTGGRVCREGLDRFKVEDGELDAHKWKNRDNSVIVNKTDNKVVSSRIENSGWDCGEFAFLQRRSDRGFRAFLALPIDCG